MFDKEEWWKLVRLLSKLIITSNSSLDLSRFEFRQITPSNGHVFVTFHSEQNIFVDDTSVTFHNPVSFFFLNV